MTVCNSIKLNRILVNYVPRNLHLSLATQLLT
jgi:hypothetical protein